MAAAPQLGAERVRIHDALGRVLAQDVPADMDMPPFDKSAMDGYACRRQDLADPLEVIETIQAGQVPQRTIGENQCAKIMTGAMLPKGADCVIMIEFTETSGETTVRFTGGHTRDNVCPQGEDIRKGELVLHKGARIGPQEIAMLATVGCVEPVVARRPAVGIIGTGDELVEPSATPTPAQIRNSNSYQLEAHVATVSAVPYNLGVAKDTEAAIDAALKHAIAETDVVLLSGGVSMGDFDLVPKVLRQNHIELLFEKIAIKPGKPTVFGVSDGACFFGLPGNPVSTFVLFEILVKPFLFKMMGHEFRPPIISARLENAIRRKRTEREAWIPVAFTADGGVTTVEYHGSAHSHALCYADGLVRVPPRVDRIEEGSYVRVRQIRS